MAIYLVVATYFAWQYLTHREELAICLDFPKEQLQQWWMERGTGENEGEKKGSSSGGVGEFWGNLKNQAIAVGQRGQNLASEAGQVASQAGELVNETQVVMKESGEVADGWQELWSKLRGLSKNNGEAGEGE